MGEGLRKFSFQPPDVSTFLQLLWAGAGSPGVLGEKSKHVVLGNVIKLPLITLESKSIRPYPQETRTTSFWHELYIDR